MEIFALFYLLSFSFVMCVAIGRASPIFFFEEIYLLVSLTIHKKKCTTRTLHEVKEFDLINEFNDTEQHTQRLLKITQKYVLLMKRIPSADQNRTSLASFFHNKPRNYRFMSNK